MMDVVKFFLGIAIVAFTSFCGRLLAKKYRQRMQFFCQLKEFNERFLSEISYCRRPLKEFIVAYSYEGEFEELLRDFCIFLKEDGSLPRFSVDEGKYMFLKPEDKQVVEDYFSMLGRGDSSSQKGYFSSLKDMLSKMQIETQNNANRYVDLYVKIGFLCGLLVLILII